jgi:hypothetical protein
VDYVGEMGGIMWKYLSLKGKKLVSQLLKERLKRSRFKVGGV